jgi:hypothetical protein
MANNGSNGTSSNGDNGYWPIVLDVMTHFAGGHGIDNLLSAVLARAPDMLRDGETIPEFQRRLAKLLVANGYHGADKPGWVVPQPANQLSLQDAAAFSLETASPGHRAGLHARPAPSKEDVERAALSAVTSAADVARQRQEEDALADLLLGPVALSAFDEPKQTPGSVEHQERSPFPRRNRRVLSRSKWGGTARDAGPRRRLVSRKSKGFTEHVLGALDSVSRGIQERAAEQRAGGGQQPEW